MRHKSQDNAHLWDILAAADGIVLSVAGLELKHYLANENLRMAVERRVEIIGEAARRVSDAFRQSHPEIPWRALVSQRNVLAHRYDEVDDHLMWRVATIRVPELIALVKPLLPARPPDPEPET